jgi:glyoxylase-like metal-dependent hydrolase (beta-lactamase superfamily II)
MVGPVPATWAIPVDAVRAFPLLPGLWQLRLPTPWNGLPATNAFVLEREDGGVTLVDCGGGGHPSTWEALVRAIGNAGFALDDVRLLVATHYHSDHVGEAARIKVTTGCPVAGSASTLHCFEAWSAPEKVREDRIELARRDGAPEELWPAFGTIEEELTGFAGPVEPDIVLIDGSTVSSTLGEWTVVMTPGHSPSHLCLYQAEHGLLLAGDLIAPAFVPYFDMGYTPDPAGEQLASLRAVGELQPRIAFPGHGRAIDDVDQVLGVHLAGMETLLDTHVKLIAEGPKTAFECVRARNPGEDDPAALVWRWCESSASLIHLARSGHAERLEARDGTVGYASRN